MNKPKPQLIYSIGVDIGTSTMMVRISKFYMSHFINMSYIHETKICKKEIIYKSPIDFTPMDDKSCIEYGQVIEYIDACILKSNIDKSEISTGAIIITGEAGRKKNASLVVKKLSDYLGDFVVATAGPNLESLLAGYGAGINKKSKQMSTSVLNFDIGGGTTNACLFADGEQKALFAFDIGGRLIRLNENWIVTYISKRIRFIIEKLNLDIKEGKKATYDCLKKLCNYLAMLLIETYEKEEISSDIKNLMITDLPLVKAEYISFSGGVAEYISGKPMNNMIMHGDIGIMLGKSIHDVIQKRNLKVIETEENIGATVVGACNHTLKLSGNTIMYSEDCLPIKNIPIIKIAYKKQEARRLQDELIKRYSLLYKRQIAVAIGGIHTLTYPELTELAKGLVGFFELIDCHIVIIIKNDYAKALGQIMKSLYTGENKIICLDKIQTNENDYIDIGRPIGDVVPVVIKTLIFNS